MKNSEAIIWIKNLNSPKSMANVKEKITAIKLISDGNLNNVTKEDLRCCINWLLTERENFIDTEISKGRQYISNKMWDITPLQVCSNSTQKTIVCGATGIECSNCQPICNSRREIK